MYKYATNPLTKSDVGLGEWVISGSLKINRALTQEECDTILKEHGLQPQEWEGGNLDLASLGYAEDEQDTARKTLVPITRDTDGKIIPLSQRFDKENANVLYQSVWHGSPYDFDAFDLKNAGEGEGNQIHGYGHYFSKQMDTASGYKWMFSNTMITTEDEVFTTKDGISDVLYDAYGKEVIEDNPKDAAIVYYNLADGDIKEARKNLESALGSILLQGVDKKECLDYFDKHAAGWKTETFSEGKLYEVDIPDDEYMLIEDATIDQQSPIVQKALRAALNFKDEMANLEAAVMASGDKVAIKAFAVIEEEFQANLDENYQQFGWTDAAEDAAFLIDYRIGESIHMDMADIQAAFENDLASDIYNPRLTGRQIYRNIAIGHTRSATEQEASNLLHSHGVKGIKYDGRQDGPCYVVFDDEDVTIKQKFQQGSRDILGSTKTIGDGKRLISLFEKANESTFIHEAGHVFLMDLQDLAKIDKESARDLETVRAWAVWKEGAAAEYKNTPWEKEFRVRENRILQAVHRGDKTQALLLKQEWMQERFARGLESYIENGKAPSPKLSSVFKKASSWIKSVYKGFKRLGGKPSPEVANVMDKMLMPEKVKSKGSKTKTGR